MSLSVESPSPEKTPAFKGSTYRLPLRMLLVLVNVVVVIELLMLTKIIKTGDYLFHIEASAALAQGQPLDFPHRLFHYMVIVLQALIPGASFTAAAVFASLLAYIACSIIIAVSLHRQLRGRHPWIAVGLAACLLFIAPIYLFDIGTNTFNMSYVYLHQSYHNPTTILMRPLALIVFLYGASALYSPLATWSQIAMAAFATFLLGNAKPNYSMAFVPGAIVTIYYRFRRRFVDYKMLFAIIGMMLLLLGAQYLSTFNTGGASTGVAVKPFAFLMRRGFGVPEILAKHFLSIVFPVAVLGLYWNKARRDAFIGLAWVVFIFGTSFELLVVELGDRVDHGNFYWTGEITLFVLFFASVHFWLRAMECQLDFKSPRARIVWVIGLLHLLSGLLWYWLHYSLLP